MALLAMSVCPLPGAMEVWLVSSVVMLAETDTAGRHVVVEHPQEASMGDILGRFSTHPSLKAYREFVQDWDPLYTEPGLPQTDIQIRETYRSSSELAQLSTIRERCCLVHNATSRTLTLVLLNEEEAAKDAGWMQKALKRHPVGRILERAKKGKDETENKDAKPQVVIGAGDIVKVDLIVPEDRGSDSEESVDIGGGDEGSPSDKNSPNAVRYIKGNFHYGTGETKEKAIGDSALVPGQVVSFVCVESPIQVVYRSLADQKVDRSVGISNDSFEKITVKCDQAASSFHLETALDPGCRICFEGRNPEARKVFAKTMNFDDTYKVTIVKGKQELNSEVGCGQVLKVEGIQM